MLLAYDSSSGLSQAANPVRMAFAKRAQGMGGQMAGPNGRDTQDRHEASEILVEEMVTYVAALRRYALLLVGDPSDADDIVQETLTRVLAQARGWREVRDLKPYLFATMHNVHIDHTRRLKRTGHTVAVDDVISLLSSPATQHKRLEFRDLVQALSKLPVEQREVVLLVGVEGMSYAEAAESLTVPIGTIMSRLSRGREALRQMTDRKVLTRLRVIK